MELPFLHQSTVNRVFRLRVNDIDDHRLRLQESVNAVNRLDEIMKLIINADKNRPVTVILEIAAAAGQALFRGEQADFAV